MTTPVFDSRQSRGSAIAKVEANVVRVSQFEYHVKSQSGDAWYVVVSTEAGWSCSCPDFAFRGVKCKHQFAVELSLQIRRRIENARRVVPLDYQSCLSCGSERIKKDGLLHNRGGNIQRFECLSCGKRFSKNFGFERMRSNPKVITLAMQMYFGGESLRNVQKSLRLQGVTVNHTTVYRWIQKYTGLMDEYLKDFTPQVSDTWRADEVFVKVKGDMKYLFSMMDDETRYWIAQQVSNFKENTNATQLFRKAKETAGKQPKTLITDGLRTYGIASHFEFPHTAHIKEIRLSGMVHNNKMERLNGEFRDREKVMRGLKRIDTPIIKGLQIYHNFIRPHEGLNGATPAERAGIKVEGENKWETIIQNAQHQRRNREDSQHP
ncbi:MAG: IS6 family transposase [Nitrososphaerales archaeon]|nr:IS6 family transposase [Nitrososphaerales archaeon]